MSTLVVLTAVLLVVMCFAYFNIRTQQTKADLNEVPQLKKGADYDTESTLLKQMAREKKIQIQTARKPKVSVHLGGGDGSIKGLEPLINKLRQTVDLIFVVGKGCAAEVESICEGHHPVRVFSYATMVGSIALIRQLSPAVHIETSSQHFNVLRKFLPSIISLNGVAGEEVSMASDANENCSIATYDRLDEALQSLILL